MHKNFNPGSRAREGVDSVGLPTIVRLMPDDGGRPSGMPDRGYMEQLPPLAA
ncbi:MAG: hypothetical protein ABIH24_02600 [Verrucomicrobiota bacterium]